jgi:hypothetical protein
MLIVIIANRSLCGGESNVSDHLAYGKSVSDHLAYGKLSDSEQRHKCPSLERTTLGQFPPENNPWVNFSQKTTPGSVFPENNFRYIAQHKYTIMAFPTQNK